MVQGLHREEWGLRYGRRYLLASLGVAFMCDSILEGSFPVNGSFPVVPQSNSWRIL